jgi:hypothetical protein
MSAEMIIGSVLAAIILLRWLKWLRGDRQLSKEASAQYE